MREFSMHSKTDSIQLVLTCDVGIKEKVKRQNLKQKPLNKINVLCRQKSVKSVQ